MRKLLKNLLLIATLATISSCLVVKPQEIKNKYGSPLFAICVYPDTKDPKKITFKLFVNDTLHSVEAQKYFELLKPKKNKTNE